MALLCFISSPFAETLIIFTEVTRVVLSYLVILSVPRAHALNINEAWRQIASKTARIK